MAKICVFLADGFEEVEGLTVVDLLRRANQEVTMVSVTHDLTIIGSHKIQVSADVLYDEMDYSDVDMIVLPGGMPGTNYLGEHKKLMNMVQSFADDEDKWVAAICAAPSLLGNMGLLQGKKAVCYPGYENCLKGAEIADKKAVTDGHIITGRGVGCAIAFSLEIIEQLTDKQTAHEIKESIVYGH
ncbi:MAG: DJ-1/PfpI family protein [Lachnospiraceae bacterium]|nr:DJ-1/PfpI family protein [Lachnospiraceae bacterium]MDD3615347.1 DJ-1/PfpI family protein [Lachnospiraceae bacterium]